MADLHRAGRYDRMSADVLTLTGQGPLSQPQRGAHIIAPRWGEKNGKLFFKGYYRAEQLLSVFSFQFVYTDATI
jgi:hypothetical protein